MAYLFPLCLFWLVAQETGETLQTSNLLSSEVCRWAHEVSGNVWTFPLEGGKAHGVGSLGAVGANRSFQGTQKTFLFLSMLTKSKRIKAPISPSQRWKWQRFVCVLVCSVRVSQLEFREEMSPSEGQAGWGCWGTGCSQGFAAVLALRWLSGFTVKCSRRFCPAPEPWPVPHGEGRP